MKEIGNLLKEAREARGITLQEVSVHLKINTKVLKAIEDGDQTNLPARTFLRGFIHSYGAYLKVNRTLIEETFQKEMGIAHPGMIIRPEPPLAPPPPPVEEVPKITPKKMSSAPVEPVAPAIAVDPQAWSSYVKIGLVVFVIVIITLILGVKKTIEKYEREATITEVAPPPINNPPNMELVNPEGQDAMTAGTLGLAGSPIPSTPEATLSAVDIATSALKPAVAISATPIPSPISTAVAPPPASTELVKPVASDEVKSTETATGTTTTPEIAKPAEPKMAPQEVIIEALDKVTVEYSIDDGPKQSIVLNAEKVHTFKGKAKLHLVFSDGGSINIIHNGKDRGVPGNLGQPLKLLFPQ